MLLVVHSFIMCDALNLDMSCVQPHMAKSMFEICKSFDEKVIVEDRKRLDYDTLKLHTSEIRNLYTYNIICGYIRNFWVSRFSQVLLFPRIKEVSNASSDTLWLNWNMISKNFTLENFLPYGSLSQTVSHFVMNIVMVTVWTSLQSHPRQGQGPHYIVSLKCLIVGLRVGGEGFDGSHDAVSHMASPQHAICSESLSIWE